MQRGGAEVFRLNPGYAYRAWLEYNRALLDFCEANLERCVLVSTNALTSSAESPVMLSQTIASRLGIELAPDALASGVDSKLFTAGDADDHRADLVAAAYPECTDLLARLEAAADISGAGLWRSERPPRPASPPRPSSTSSACSGGTRSTPAPSIDVSCGAASAATTR